MTESLDTMERESKQYIVVKIGSEQYGIDISYIDNIVIMQNITRVPSAQMYFKGIINLRGEIVPVMSIRLRMGLEDDEITSLSRIIILKIEEQGAVGIIVDEVKEVVRLSANEIDRNVQDMKEEKSNFINGIGKSNDQLISLLEIGSIIEEEIL
ncbi:MAG: chemotaxis protein CheW [Eubacterium sp.]|jgi:Chemotaxis signal transduction protein|nr:chemotaxis protein CheW [Eubacterium sp.]